MLYFFHIEEYNLLIMKEAGGNIIKIRLASIADAPALQRIYRPYVEQTAVSFEYEAPDAAEFERRIAHTLLAYPYLIAEDETGIVGYAYAGAFHPRQAYQHGAEVSIYVDWNQRCLGVGNLLYDRLQQLLEKQNVFRLYACIAATDRKDDAHLTDGSIRFHEKMGFSIVGRYRSCGYKFDSWYDMVWMEKQIREPMACPEPFIPFVQCEFWRFKEELS